MVIVTTAGPGVKGAGRQAGGPARRGAPLLDLSACDFDPGFRAAAVCGRHRMNLPTFLAQLAERPDWSKAGPITPSTRAANGDTPLHAAIWAADDEAARALIDAGADIDRHAGEDGYTPLHAAIAQSARGPGAAPDRSRRVVGGDELVRLLGARGRPSLRRSRPFAPCSTEQAGQPVAGPDRPLPPRVRATTAISGSISNACVRGPEFMRQRAAALAGPARSRTASTSSAGRSSKARSSR